MKKNLISITLSMVLFSTILIATSCKKNSDVQAVTDEISVSKKVDVKLKEPVTVSYTKAVGSSVNWSVTPTKGVWIEQMGNEAKFRFGLSGNYTITAISGANISSTSIAVTGARYSGADSTGGNPADSSGYNPIDSPAHTPCDPSVTHISVNLLPTQSTLSILTTTDSSGNTSKDIQFDVTFALPTTCYTYKIVNVADTGFVHSVVIFGDKNTCPDANCIATPTSSTATSYVFSPAKGLHTFNYFKDGAFVFSRTIQVN